MSETEPGTAAIGRLPGRRWGSIDFGLYREERPQWGPVPNSLPAFQRRNPSLHQRRPSASAPSERFAITLTIPQPLSTIDSGGFPTSIIRLICVQDLLCDGDGACACRCIILLDGRNSLRACLHNQRAVWHASHRNEKIKHELRGAYPRGGQLSSVLDSFVCDCVAKSGSPVCIYKWPNSQEEMTPTQQFQYLFLFPNKIASCSFTGLLLSQHLYLLIQGKGLIGK